MPINDGDILVASARFRDVQGNDVVNVYNFRCALAAPIADQDAIDGVDAYISSFYTTLDGYMDGDAAPYDLKVDVVEFIGGEWKVTHNVGFDSWGVPLAMSGAGEPLPHGSAILVKLFTGLGKHTGKKFLGLFNDNALNSLGNVAAVVQAAAATDFAKILAPFVFTAGNTLVGVVLDRADGTVRDILSVAVSDVFAYQRRRRPGTGS